LDEFLARPNAALSDHTDGRGYGAFIFAEFLEEQFAQFGEFSGSGDLIPDPGIIREIWDEIDVVAPSWTIAQVIQEEDAGLEDVLGAFHRAMYLLDSTVGTHRFAGTIRDQDLSDWRPILGGDGPTGGDTGFPEVSAVPRAARERVELPGRTATRWSDPVAVSVDAGGAAYVEMLIPSDGANTYEVQVRAPGTNVFLRATAIPFGAGDPPPGSAYPTPCAYDTAFSTVLEGDDTVAHAKLVIPDNCGAITVIVSNAHTIAEPFTAEVLARTSSVADQFERLRPGGWGVADKGWIWRDPGGGPVDGFVVERAAHLSGAGSSAQLSLTGVNIDTLLLVGRFADCEDPAQILGVGLPDQAPVFLRSDGLLFAHPDIAVVDSFVPCEPWYLRLDHGGARVWQATKPEPIDWPVTVPGDDPRFHYLRLFADHAAGGDNEVMIDVLDLTWVSG
jgi:hypothetical protein